MLDLPHLPRTNRKPAIYMEEVAVGRNVQPPGHELVLPPGTHHVELHFDAIEISSPEKVHLQYRLDNVDSEWLDAGTPAHAIYLSVTCTSATYWEATRERETSCPTCGHYQVLILGDGTGPGLVWPEDIPEDAMYRCAGCRELIPARQKAWVVDRGEYRA
jgi:DNA-directed RNA polymerase subunit RPC12/RpoP